MAEAEISVEIEPEVEADSSGADAAEAHADNAAIREEHATEAADDSEAAAAVSVDAAIGASEAASVAVEAAISASQDKAETEYAIADLREDLNALPEKIAAALVSAAQTQAPESQADTSPPVEDEAPAETHWWTKKRFVRKNSGE